MQSTAAHPSRWVLLVNTSQGNKLLLGLFAAGGAAAAAIVEERCIERDESRAEGGESEGAHGHHQRELVVGHGERVGKEMMDFPERDNHFSREKQGREP